MNCPENAPVSTSLIIVLAIINHAFECSTKPKCPASGNVIRAAVSCYAMNFTSLRHDVTYHNTNILNPECHVARPIYAAANARRTVEEIYARAMLFLWQPPSSRTKGGCHTSRGHQQTAAGICAWEADLAGGRQAGGNCECGAGGSESNDFERTAVFEYTVRSLSRCRPGDRACVPAARQAKRVA